VPPFLLAVLCKIPRRATSRLAESSPGVTWNVVLVFVPSLRVARRELDAAARVAFFGSLGRSYERWAARGIAQARRMTRLRHRAVIEPRDPRLLALIDRGTRHAFIVRASIGTLTLALLGLGVVLAERSRVAFLHRRYVKGLLGASISHRVVVKILGSGGSPWHT
jgi:hypothetical protein